MALFSNRKDAGEKLAQKLDDLTNRPDVIVLGLAPSGMPAAYEVARALNVPLDVFIVNELATPGNEHIVLGAIASGGVRVLDIEKVHDLQIADSSLNVLESREREVLEQQEFVYRGYRPVARLQGQTVILVDDHIDTGAMMRTAVLAVKEHNPGRIIVAVPVASRTAYTALAQEVSEVVALEIPDEFEGGESYYNDYSEVLDEDVRDLLNRAAAPPGKPSGDVL